MIIIIIKKCRFHKSSFDSLGQGSQTQLNWGPLKVESGSDWAASSIPQKKNSIQVFQERSTTNPIFSIFIINVSSEIL